MAYDDDTYSSSSSDDEYCKVYDKNDFFTLVVQMLLAALALGSLYIKRLREVPRRTFRTWFLDVSKQGFGACFAHILNMVRLLLLILHCCEWTQNRIRFVSRLLR